MASTCFTQLHGLSNGRDSNPVHASFNCSVAYGHSAMAVGVRLQRRREQDIRANNTAKLAHVVLDCTQIANDSGRQVRLLKCAGRSNDVLFAQSGQVARGKRSPRVGRL